MKIRFNLFIIFFIMYCSLSMFKCVAQDVIDIVDPYEMKVSRSREADTFYFSQKATTAVGQSKQDTLRSYDVFLEERPTPFGIAYMCNGSEVTKVKYNDYKLYWNASGACKPCMLYTYNDKDQLKYVAYQYEDCLCGNYIEYYADGGKKLKGQFKENTTGNWSNMKGRDLCNVRDGAWTYYYPNGVEEKTELYEEGKLKSITRPSVNTSSSTKKTVAGTEETGDETPQKKGWIQKMKDKNKPTNN